MYKEGVEVELNATSGITGRAQNYFEEFWPRKRFANGMRLISVCGFKPDMLMEGCFVHQKDTREEPEETEGAVDSSLFDAEYAGMPAQFANPEGDAPAVGRCRQLGTINTSELYYVKVPQNRYCGST